MPQSFLAAQSHADIQGLNSLGPQNHIALSSLISYEGEARAEKRHYKHLKLHIFSMIRANPYFM